MKRFKNFLPGIIWLITSFILLAMPAEDLPESGFFDIPFFDKYVHFCMFFLLTFLFCIPFSLQNTSFKPWKPVSLMITVCVVLYGITMEFVQKYFVAGRAFDLADILFDTVGSFGGWICIRQFFFIKNRPR